MTDPMTGTRDLPGETLDEPGRSDGTASKRRDANETTGTTADRRDTTSRELN